MENKRLKLSIGIQTFEKMRERNCVYVDKTKYLVDLIDNVDICFHARPRHFGKSLAVSTFNALFSGKKELFKGLYAEEFLNRPDFETSPVISLNMSSITTNQGIEIELKVAYAGENPAQKTEEALQQIVDKNYATQYPDAVCMGLAIDDAARQITDYKLGLRNRKSKK